MAAAWNCSSRPPALGGRAGFLPRSGRAGNSSISASTWRWAAAPTSSTSAAAWAWPNASSAVRTLHFFGPDGARSDFAATGWLPAPLHLLPAMLRQRHLALGERWQALRGLARLARRRGRAGISPRRPSAQWLGRQGQSPRVVARFWAPIILGALGETPERASLSAARKVFVDWLFGLARGLSAAAAAAAAARADRRPHGGVAGRPRREHSSRHAGPPDRRRRRGRRLPACCWPTARGGRSIASLRPCPGAASPARC